jgi:CRP-like cAMP-binding protein
VGWFLDLLLGADIVQLRADRAASIRREHFEAGETIFREGDRGDRVYVIVDGEIDIVRAAPGGGETLIVRLGQGETFGEIALVRDTPRNATARSASKVNLLSMDRETFQTLFATMPPLRRLFEELIDSRIGAAPAR